MRSLPSILAAIVLAALTGCGAGTAPSAPASPYLNLSGNWEAIGLSPLQSQGVLTTPIAAFMGALQSSNGNVTGTLRAFDINFSAPCVSLMQDLTATGTLSTSGTLVLTVPISGGTATLNATLGTNLNTYISGSWTIVGGSCAMPATVMSIMQYAPVTGTYTGTLATYGGTNNATAVTAVLTQSTTPNADGQFALSGTVTYAGTGPCAGTYPLTPEYVTGNGLFVSSIAVQSPSASVGGAIVPTAATITGNTTIFSLNCLIGPLSGTLTRQ